MQKVFEHTIDLSAYLARGLTRDKLWVGLEDFARNPHDYVENMQASRVTPCASDDGKTRLARELDFGGSLVVSDVAELCAPERFTTLVPACGPIPDSRLDITIEAREGLLQLHFAYHEADSEASRELNAAMQTLRHKAWLAKDQEVVKLLLAALVD